MKLGEMNNELAKVKRDLTSTTNTLKGILS